MRQIARVLGCSPATVKKALASPASLCCWVLSDVSLGASCLKQTHWTEVFLQRHMALGTGLTILALRKCQATAFETSTERRRSRLTEEPLSRVVALNASSPMPVNQGYQIPGLPTDFRQPFQVQVLLCSCLIQLVGVTL